ncbi:hypothetical protein DFR70_111111 [Nocardia tenerifensis]|uniref:Biotin carboxylation domain-containing protein n=1 Tax=Nocardia tenerifensis TaxID=228006 RepID=A0A318JYD3_9NOCA|nr:hypothetical protein [Nocardia tenerifensis]PXX59727.1 hypothetical protein DFR70_111111 [Nocardia tenerifensis]
MRSLTGLRRRPAAAPARTETPTQAAYSDPTVDPPIVAALVRPLLQLRSTLGTGVGVPNQTATSALSSASTQAADVEGPHRDGLHALESTWTSRGADAAVPALRTTQTEIGEISDRGPAYLSVLGDAHATSARAARTVDQIIADFRRDAREILGNATAAPDTDAVIARATQALRDALTTVNVAQTEMDDHSRRLDQMGPLTVTQPTGVTAAQPGATGQFIPGGTSQFVPGTTTPGIGGTVPGIGGTAQQPMDPALAAQLQLQQQLINAGVQVGTAAINAGVDIGTNIIDKIAGVGTHIVDKIADVGTHAIDTVAAGADKAVTEAIRPGSTTGDQSSSSSSSANSSTSPKLFDFGAGARPSTPTPPTGPGTVVPPAQNGSAPSARVEAAPPPESRPAPAPVQEAPAPSDTPSRSANPDQQSHSGTGGGVAMPPPPRADDPEHKPKDGQLGVTVPTAAVAVTPVLGDYDDDTL